MRRTFLLVLIALIGMLVVGTSQAFAIDRWVNDNDPNGGAYTPPGTSCNNPGYATIDSAVDTSAPGDRVNVCPGTYSEVVSVPAGKNNLTVRSVNPLAAVIQAPASIAGDLANFKSIVRITTSTNVTLTRFVITGPGPGTCDSIRYGVRVDGGGSANILFNHITKIRDTDPASLDPPTSGCQNGVAIQVGRQADLTTGRATILGNLVDDYQKNGMTIDNAGSDALIVDNRVHGIGPTPVIAQNGIQISRGAVATARGNRIQDNTYTVPPNLPITGGTGFLLFDAPAGTTISSNWLVRNDWNINASGSTNGVVIRRNTALDATEFDGISMAATTSNNRIEENFLRGNQRFDCRDASIGPHNSPAMVANPWINNDGITENKPGLCQPRQEECPDDDQDDDGLNDSRELLLLTLINNPDSNFNGVKDGNDDSNGNGEDDEDEDDDDDPCPNDSDHDGEDDEDEDDD